MGGLLRCNSCLYPLKPQAPKANGPSSGAEKAAAVLGVVSGR